MLLTLACSTLQAQTTADTGAAQGRAVPQDRFIDPLDAPAPMHPSIAGRPMMAVALAGERLVAVGMRGLIAVSGDSGKTWEQVSAPVSSDLLALSFPTALQGWAVGHDGVVLHTTDGGRSWLKQFDGRMAATTLVDNYKARIAAGDARLQPYLDQVVLNDKAGPSLPWLNVWFKDAQHGMAVGPFGMAIATDDGGRHWIPILDRIDNPQFLHLDAICEVAGEVYIAGERGTVFRLDRASGIFHPVDTGYSGSFFGISGNDEVLLAYGLKGTVYRSGDHGATWTRLQSPLRGAVTGAAYLPERHAFVLVTAAGEIALTDAATQALRPLNTRRPMPITGVQALTSTQVLVSALDGVSPVALQ